MPEPRANPRSSLVQTRKLRFPQAFVASLIIATLVQSTHAAAQSPSIDSREVPSMNVNSSIMAPTTPSNATCGFEGDSNTYGLGIRLGVYIQWVTTVIAYNLLPDEAPTMRQVNTLFTLSNFIGLIYITSLRGSGTELYAVECWIVLSFCLGGICSQYVNTTKGITAGVGWSNYKATFSGTLLRTFLTSATLYYTIWYFYKGIDMMKFTPCSTSAFFFAKVNIFHWFRTFNKVIFTFGVIGDSIWLLITIMLLIWLLAAIYNAKGMEGLKELYFTYVVTKKDSERPYVRKRYPLNLGILFPLFGFILNTELLIRWNHISGVHSIDGIGQIIPLVIAGAGLIRVFWKLIVRVLKLVNYDESIGQEVYSEVESEGEEDDIKSLSAKYPKDNSDEQVPQAVSLTESDLGSSRPPYPEQPHLAPNSLNN